MKNLTLAFLALYAAGQAEPTPRKPVTAPLTMAPRAHVSSVAELADGRLVISDKRTPAVFIFDPTKGTTMALGAPGAGPGRYAKPGGLYGGLGHPLLLLDQGQMKAIAVSSAGTLGDAAPFGPQGTSGSSDGDRDMYLLDSRGRSYFIDPESRMRARLSRNAPVDLLRFDATTQKGTVVTSLRQRDSRTIPGGDGMTFSRAVIGSPEDGWGVGPDGRVAVVRAVPYRVDWYSAAGVESKGPVYETPTLPMTQADRDAFTKANAGLGVSVGVSSTSGGGSTASPGPIFADTKAPFDADTVVVSPSGHVWVERTRPFADKEVLYDVFDSSGRRVHRLVFVEDALVVGFGKSAVYVREPAPGGVTLKKYEVR